MPVYLYVITNTVTGKKYVGITQDPAERRKQHFEYGDGSGSRYLKRSIKKYGVSAFRMQLITYGTFEEMCQLEKVIIQRLSTKAPNGYNLTDGGEGACGRIPSQESRQRMSDAQKHRRHTDAERERCRTLWRGRNHTTTTKMKMAEAAKRRALEHPDTLATTVVTVNGTTFPSLKAAATSLGLKPTTLSSRLRYYKKTGRWPQGWCYGTPTSCVSSA